MNINKFLIAFAFPLSLSIGACDDADGRPGFESEARELEDSASDACLPDGDTVCSPMEVTAYEGDYCEIDDDGMNGEERKLEQRGTLSIPGACEGNDMLKHVLRDAVLDIKVKDKDPNDPDLRIRFSFDGPCSGTNQKYKLIVTPDEKDYKRSDGDKPWHKHILIQAVIDEWLDAGRPEDLSFTLDVADLYGADGRGPECM